MQIASYIDHSYLKPDCTEAVIDKLMREAEDYGFKAICIPPAFVRYAHEHGAERSFLICAVAGFPIGYDHLSAKLASLAHSASMGADEVDVVIQFATVRSGQWRLVKDELTALQNTAREHQVTLKCIIEAPLLMDEEIIRICEISNEVGLDFVKTSTGFFGEPVLEEIVRLLRRHLNPSIHIKASGGIHHYPQALQMIQAGADRLGCSQSTQIVNEATS